MAIAGVRLPPDEVRGAEHADGHHHDQRGHEEQEDRQRDPAGPRFDTTQHPAVTLAGRVLLYIHDSHWGWTKLGQ